MSVILAIKKNDRIYLAADTQISCGDTRITTLTSFDRKIHKLDNGILLGITGAVSSAQIVCAYSEIFTVPEDGIITKKHIVQNIIPKLRKLYSDRGMLEENENEPDSLPNTFVLAYKDKLFFIANVFSVTVIEHYVAIGAGADVTLYGLSRLDGEECDEDALKEKLLELLILSASRVRSVGAPFYLIDTAHQSFELIKE